MKSFFLVPLAIAAKFVAADDQLIEINDPAYISLTKALIQATDSAVEASLLGDLNNYMNTMSKSYFTPTVDGTVLTGPTAA